MWRGFLTLLEITTIFFLEQTVFSDPGLSAAILCLGPDSQLQAKRGRHNLATATACGICSGLRITRHRSLVTIIPYSFDASSSIKSRQRLEYPHSLSYHANIFAQFAPTTRV